MAHSSIVNISTKVFCKRLRFCWIKKVFEKSYFCKSRVNISLVDFPLLNVLEIGTDKGGVSTLKDSYICLLIFLIYAMHGFIKFNTMDGCKVLRFCFYDSLEFICKFCFGL